MLAEILKYVNAHNQFSIFPANLPVTFLSEEMLSFDVKVSEKNLIK